MQHVIACIDESTWSTSVQDAAIWAAGQFNCPITFVHSIEKQRAHEPSDLSGAIGLGARSKLLSDIAALDQQRAKVALQLGKELLASAKQKALAAGCEQVDTTQRHGQLTDTVLALESNARLIVIGHSGAQSDAQDRLLGGQVETLLRHVNTPVLIAPHAFSAPSSFMLAYDGRATIEDALQRIIKSDFLRGLHCHMVTIQNKHPDLQEKFSRASQRLIDSGYNVTATYLEGDIFQQLLSYQQEHAVDMLVMGAFSGTRLRQFFIGSNTLKMLENSPLPTVIIK